MAGAGSSVQTTYLQMAAAKEFGIENYKKLNPMMVNLPHPEGLRALLSGSKEITSQFTSPPFQNTALENPGIRTVLNSYDIMGGPNTFLMVWATKKFRDENPKTYKAVVDALKEATDAINADKKRAAEVYVKEGGGKESVDKILEDHERPAGALHSWRPERILPYRAVHAPGRHDQDQAGILEGPVLPGHPRAGRQLSGATRSSGSGGWHEQAQPQPLLQVEGVTLQYKTREHLVTATYRVSFDVLRGRPLRAARAVGLREIDAAQGGRRLHGADRGRACALKGQPITQPGPDRVMVFQEFDQLLPWKTVKQNVMFALEASGKLTRQGRRGRAPCATSRRST